MTTHVSPRAIDREAPEPERPTGRGGRGPLRPVALTVSGVVALVIVTAVLWPRGSADTEAPTEPSTTSTAEAGIATDEPPVASSAPDQDTEPVAVFSQEAKRPRAGLPDGHWQNPAAGSALEDPAYEPDCLRGGRC